MILHVDPPFKKLHNQTDTIVEGNSIPFSHHISENAVMDRHNPKAVYMYAINDCSICNMQYYACNFYKFFNSLPTNSIVCFCYFF